MSKEFYDCISEWADRCREVEAERDRLAKELEQAKAKVRELTAWYDKMFGTPCEEIRHQQQVEKLEEELAALKANAPRWTTEQPKEHGWYWARWPDHPQLGPEILEIVQPDGPDTDNLEVGHKPLSVSLERYIIENYPVEWQPVAGPGEG